MKLFWPGWDSRNTVMALDTGSSVPVSGGSLSGSAIFTRITLAATSCR